MFILFFIVVLLGGNSREDFPGLVILYPASIFLATVALAMPGGVDWRDVCAPLGLLSAFALLVVLQVVPLPPGIWAALSHRLEWTAGVRAAGIDLGWQPLSISPDSTLDALPWLAVPAAMLAAIASASRDSVRLLLPALLVSMLISAALGIAQYATGDKSLLYFHPNAVPGEVVGFFANRNHHAVFLAMGIPLGAAACTSVTLPKRLQALVLLAYFAFATFLTAVVIMAGSRGGLATLGLGVLLSAALIYPRMDEIRMLFAKGGGRFAIAAGVSIIVTLCALIAIALSTRGIAVSRFDQTDVVNELRWRTLPVVLDIWREHWLAGTGLGTFNQLYRIYEPLALLQPLYLNHAHNDLLELAVTGGLPGLAIILVFGLWLLRSFWMALKSSSPVAIASGIAIVQLLIASLFDYPLRTPLLMVVFVVLTLWLVHSNSQHRKGLYQH